uniref:Uncharacterized protein n=1 Tax=Mycena chlorophos TaxID=658473 RepID=A0ABQ0M0Y8_MYCCL|nr:predicted protein [Mycena chlorophos]
MLPLRMARRRARQILPLQPQGLLAAPLFPTASYSIFAYCNAARLSTIASFERSAVLVPPPHARTIRPLYHLHYPRPPPRSCPRDVSTMYSSGQRVRRPALRCAGATYDSHTYARDYAGVPPALTLHPHRYLFLRRKPRNGLHRTSTSHTTNHCCTTTCLYYVRSTTLA